MITYVVLTNFTDQGIRAAKDTMKRTEAFKEMAKKFGVTVKEIFWTQGQYDIVTITEAPDEISGTALNLSICALGKYSHAIPACFFGGRNEGDHRQDGVAHADSATAHIRFGRATVWCHVGIIWLNQSGG